MERPRHYAARGSDDFDDFVINSEDGDGDDGDFVSEAGVVGDGDDGDFVNEAEVVGDNARQAGAEEKTEEKEAQMPAPSMSPSTEDQDDSSSRSRSYRRLNTATDRKWDRKRGGQMKRQSQKMTGKDMSLLRDMFKAKAGVAPERAIDSRPRIKEALRSTDYDIIIKEGKETIDELQAWLIECGRKQAANKKALLVVPQVVSSNDKDLKDLILGGLTKAGLKVQELTNQADFHCPDVHVDHNADAFVGQLGHVIDYLTAKDPDKNLPSLNTVVWVTCDEMDFWLTDMQNALNLARVLAPSAHRNVFTIGQTTTLPARLCGLMKPENTGTFHKIDEAAADAESTDPVEATQSFLSPKSVQTNRSSRSVRSEHSFASERSLKRAKRRDTVESSRSHLTRETGMFVGDQAPLSFRKGHAVFVWCGDRGDPGWVPAKVMDRCGGDFAQLRYEVPEKRDCFRGEISGKRKYFRDIVTSPKNAVVREVKGSQDALADERFREYRFKKDCQVAAKDRQTGVARSGRRHNPDTVLLERFVYPCLVDTSPWNQFRRKRLAANGKDWCWIIQTRSDKTVWEMCWTTISNVFAVTYADVYMRLGSILKKELKLDDKAVHKAIRNRIQQVGKTLRLDPTLMIADWQGKNANPDPWASKVHKMHEMVCKW